MPQPSTSSQRVLPSGCCQAMSTSAPGSTNGKSSAEAHFEIALEERAHELGQRALEVGEGRMLVHQQAFDLMEHRRMGLVAVAAVHLAGGDHAQRRRGRPCSAPAPPEVCVRSRRPSPK
jgi:hypothetical protein